ncbi:MAG: hypothetical protein Kow00124_07800 [Anaerolineae bacterium]
MIAVTAAVIAAVPVTYAGTPIAQDEQPTGTPTVPGPVIIGPTYTPSPTLPPAPPRGGLVAVTALAVLSAPSADASYVGDLVYGDAVFPLARSEDGRWVAIPWETLPEGRVGWVISRAIVWEDVRDLAALPILQAPYLITPAPSATPSPTATATPTLSPTAAPTSTPEPVETRAPATSTDQPLPPAVPTATQELAAAAGGPSEGEQTPDEPAQQPPLEPGLIGRGLPGPAVWIGGAVFVLLAAGYTWQVLRARSEMKRYEGGFLLSQCPVCQSGTLEMDEHTDHLLGVPVVQRLVRCDSCRSLLRQIRPGVWRYTIDPFVNPDMAEHYNGKSFTDAELPGLAERARQYPPYATQEDIFSEAYQRAAEVVAEMEARFLAERAEEASEQTMTEQGPAEEAASTDAEMPTATDDSQDEAPEGREG